MNSEIERERVVSEIDYKSSITHVSLELLNDTAEVQGVLRFLEAAKLDVAFVKIHRDKMTFVVQGDITPESLQELIHRDAEVIRNCTIVSMKSPAMRMMHGVMADAVSALYSLNIDVHAANDSYDCLSLVIDGKHIRIAIGALREKFRLQEIS